MVVLGIALGVAAVTAHVAARAAGVPWLLTLVSAGQLGVPIAAVTLGIETGVLLPGEDAAILLGAVVTVVVVVAAATTVARRAAAPPGAGVATG